MLQQPKVTQQVLRPFLRSIPPFPYHASIPNKPENTIGVTDLIDINMGYGVKSEDLLPQGFYSPKVGFWGALTANTTPAQG